MKEIKLPELLSPAGNFEKMRFALHYGADAVYLAGELFGMRAAADNFSPDELKEACRYAHNLGKKVYVTVNTMPRNNELDLLPAYLEMLSDAAPDAIIVADLGVLSLAKKYAPNIEIHVSTQGAIVNYEACRMWHDLGAKRVVLARELGLDDIAGIRAKTPSDLELEAFVHGAMCVSVSGRCLLSEFYCDRDGNRGKCAQPCRWEYKFSEVKRPESELTCEIHPEGSYIFGSKDMNLIDHIPELVSCGLDSLKIEGRMKSAYYTAVVSNCYRMALDRFALDPENYQNDPKLNEELESVSHREYCTGYYFDHPMKNPQLASCVGYLGEKSFIATVDRYDSDRALIHCIQRNKISVGETAEVISPGEYGRAFRVESLYDNDFNPIESAPHPKQGFYINAPFEMKPGDIIRAGSV